MIARLRGILIERQPPRVLLEVGGVGYELECPISVFDRLPGKDESVTLLTQLVVREDSQTLYGFVDEADRDLFRELLKVSGIGPRLALVILSGISASEFVWMVESGDAQALTRLPGIGRKTAERLMLEMRGRLPQASETVSADRSSPRSDAREAQAGLVALGYSPAEAQKMVQAVQAPDLAAEQLLRAALQRKIKG